MKKSLLISACILIFFSCSKDDEETELNSENYISINGDVRYLNNPELTDIEISSFWFNGNYEEPDGVQLIIDAYDPEKKVIGNIGGFINNEIELFMDLYPKDTPAFVSNTSFTTYRYEDISLNMSSAETINYKLDKGNVNLQIITGDDDEIFNVSANSGQIFTVKSESGFYYLIIDNMQFDDVVLSAKVIIPE